jgi:hypothetical protein
VFNKIKAAAAAATAARNARHAETPKRAAGGRVKSKGGHKTQVNIIIGHPGRDSASPQSPEVGPGDVGAPPRPLIPASPPAGGFAAPAGVNMPMPMRKSGGRVAMTAGAASGVGRIEKADVAKKKGKW